MEKIAKRHEKRNILKCDFYLFKISLKQTTALQGNLGLKHQGKIRKILHVQYFAILFN